MVATSPLPNIKNSNALIAALSRVMTRTAATDHPKQVIETLGREITALGLACLVSTLDEDRQYLVADYISVQGHLLKIIEGIIGQSIPGYRMSLGFWATLAKDGYGFPRYSPTIAEVVKDLFPERTARKIDRVLRLIHPLQNVAVITLPLVVQDQVVGLLMIWGPNLLRDDIFAFSIFANQVGITLEKARLLESERKQRAQAEAQATELLQREQYLTELNKLTQAALSATDFQSMMDDLADRFAHLIHAQTCYLTLWDEARQIPVPTAASGEAKSTYPQLITLPGEPTLTAAVIQSGKPLLIEDSRNSQFLSPRLAAVFQAGSVLALPLTLDGKTAGAAIVEFEQGKMPSEMEIKLCEQAAAQVALAVAKTRALQMAQQRAGEAETLRQAGAVVAATLDPEEAIERILEQLAFVVPYDSATVQLLQNQRLEVVGGRGRIDFHNHGSNTRIQVPDSPIHTQVIREKRPVRLQMSDLGSPDQMPESHRDIRSWLGVPLIVHQQVIGMLALHSQQENFYTDDHTRLVAAFADHVALAIENAHIYTAERRRVSELDALRATVTDITGQLELGPLLDSILKRAVALVNATGGELALSNDQNSQLEIVACHNMDKDYRGYRINPGTGAMGTVAETFEPTIISNYQPWEGHLKLQQKGPWKTVMAAPLLARGRLAGVIAVVDHHSERQFTDSDLQLLILFAQQATIAIDNARLFEQTQIALADTKILYRAARSLISGRPVSEQLNSLVADVAAALPADHVLLIQVDWIEKKVLDFIKGGPGAVGIEPATFERLSQGLTGWVYEARKPALSLKGEPDPRESPFVQDQRQARKAGSIIVVPIEYGDRVLGTLTAVNRIDQRDFTQRDVDLLVMIANHAATAITNSQLFEKVQRLATIDELTGIANRRYLFQLGNTQLEKARRYQYPLSAIMLDLDHFKQINDTYGHASGDLVLQNLTMIFKSIVRSGDILGRYGGEEFVVLLPHTALKEALEVAERLRLYADQNPTPSSYGNLHTTITLGVAEFTEEVANLSMLLDRADLALYEAKQAGRNQVRAFKG